MSFKSGMLVAVISLLFVSGCRYREETRLSEASSKKKGDFVLKEFKPKDVCYTSFPIAESPSVSLNANKIECINQKAISISTKAMTLYINSIQAVCILSPVTLHVKFALAAAAAGTSAVSLVVDNIPCEDKRKPLPLSTESQEQIVKVVCESMDKEFDPKAGPNGEPGCK